MPSETIKKYYCIDPNKPLPTELGKKWEEISAKLILEHYFPNEFQDLVVDDESPDLRNEKLSIGVEVTNNESSISRKIDSLYSRKYIYGDEEKKKEISKRISDLGGHVGPYFLSHPTMSRDLTKLYKRVEGKTKKLNKNYDVFDRNYLFIFDIVMILDGELPRILEGLKTSLMNMEYTFCGVFIYCFGGDLYKFDLLNNSYLHIKESNKIIQQLMIDARSIIENKYQN